MACRPSPTLQRTGITALSDYVGSTRNVEAGGAGVGVRRPQRREGGAAWVDQGGGASCLPDTSRDLRRSQ
jgi:hypothetical protein